VPPNKLKKVVQGYVCKICKIPGHHITDCVHFKTKEVRGVGGWEGGWALLLLAS
jgi:hypothetical protein